MSSQDEFSRKAYEKWVGQQGNSSMGTQANEEGYRQYLEEQKKRNQNNSNNFNTSSSTNKNQGNSNSKNQKSSNSNKPENTSGPCWIATAYYGSATHPQVNFLRDFRNSLFQVQFLGYWVKFINKIYRFIGTTSFGIWWSHQLKSSTESNIIRFISRFLLSALNSLAMLAKKKN